MLTSTVFWNEDRSVSTMGPKWGLAAALLTRMSRRPHFDWISANAPSIWSMSPIWQASASAEPPPATMASATAWQAPALRLETMTWAPRDARSSAIAWPMPRLAPVTSAIFPVMSNGSAWEMSGIPPLSISDQALFFRYFQMRRHIERCEAQSPSPVGQDCQAGIDDRPVEFDGLGVGQAKDVLANGGNGAARGEDRQVLGRFASADRRLQAGDAAVAKIAPALRIVGI